MPSQTIPCTDCADAKARFESRGYTVNGCTPDPLRPGMCVLSYEPPALESSAAHVVPIAMAAVAGGASTAAPGAGAQAGAAQAENAELTPVQVRTAQAIVNLFETGQVLGDYGQVTLLAGDPGRLTYGRSQTTLGSGNLLILLQRYAGNAGARFGGRVREWLPLVQQGAAQLDTDSRLHNLLRACADDPVMRETQDAFFDDAYWKPAARAAQALGLLSPLAVAVVYDSHVHGSWKLLRDRTNAEAGGPDAAGERAWIERYVQIRRQWLATHKLDILHNTVYRMDAFLRLIALGQWGLGLPLVVRQAEISLAALNASPPGCYDGPPAGSRGLSLQQPLLRGLDVRLVQLALSDLGASVKADGIFGLASQRCMREWQIAQGKPVTGVADIAMIGDLTS